MNLKIGDKAPDFEGKNQNNESIKLSSFIGEKIVLYFYPRDNTPGCTAQACNLKDNFSELSRKGYKIIGHAEKFLESQNIGFLINIILNFLILNWYYLIFFFPVD